MAKVKDDQVSATVRISLRVPRGLLQFLENLHKVSGEETKAYLEEVLARELEALLGNLPNDIFDMEFLRVRYGEGSHIYKLKEVPSEPHREVKVNE